MAGTNPMSLRLKISYDVGGTWSIHGLSPTPENSFPSLSASIDYARNSCNAAPATIELVADGMYMVVHQELGWPRQLVASETSRTGSAFTQGHSAGTVAPNRLLNCLKGLLRSNTRTRLPQQISTAPGLRSG